MSTTLGYRMADRLLDGRLRERISEYRAAGVAWAAIARLLEKDGVEVTGETLRRWARHLDLDVPSKTDVAS